MKEEPCTGKRKHYSPHRCEFVPVDRCVALINRYPKLCKLVFLDDFKKWLVESHKITWGVSELNKFGVCRAHGYNRKRYWNSVASKKIQEIIQRELNYEKTTFTSGHIHARFGRIYRKHIVNLTWKYNTKDHNVTFNL